MTDLGPCEALLADAERCPGRLLPLGEVGDLVEGRCPLCGAEAAVPRAKASVAGVPNEVERWWDR